MCEQVQNALTLGRHSDILFSDDLNPDSASIRKKFRTQKVTIFDCSLFLIMLVPKYMAIDEFRAGFC